MTERVIATNETPASKPRPSVSCLRESKHHSAVFCESNSTIGGRASRGISPGTPPKPLPYLLARSSRRTLRRSPCATLGLRLRAMPSAQDDTEATASSSSLRRHRRPRIPHSRRRGYGYPREKRRMVASLWEGGGPPSRWWEPAYVKTALALPLPNLYCRILPLPHCGPPSRCGSVTLGL